MRIFYLTTISCFSACFLALQSANSWANPPANYSADNYDKSKSGGGVTVYNTSRDAFAKPAPNLSVEDLRKFTFGNKIFNTNWVTAPASVTSLDGLGPLFNRNSCSGCHTRDGRGKPPSSNSDSVTTHSILLRLSVLDKNNKAVPHPVYGDQLNTQSINGVLPEGEFEITYEEVPGRFSDGEKYSLRKPTYKFKNLNYGNLDNVMISPRVAPAIMGLGLLEAIPEKEILAMSDENDKDQDGISGKANYVFDKIKGKDAIGRFGWKANQPSIASQNTGAALGDIGITSSINPKQNCNPGQDECQKQISGGNPELSDSQLERLNFYASTLAVPARRNVDKAEVIAGEEIFDNIGCSSCHKPKLTTGNHKIKILSNQKIQPFTDLLLHDMGDDLADNRPDSLANGKEWRTPPLWGIGLVHVVNKHTNFLHDGRARNIEEAILWHDGEAKKAKDKYKDLPKKQRSELLEFLESL